MKKPVSRRCLPFLLVCLLLFLCACQAPETADIPDLEEEPQIAEAIGTSVLPASEKKPKEPVIPAWQTQGSVSLDMGFLPSDAQDVHITLCAIGDVMAHNGTYEAAFDGTTYDFDYMFADIAKYVIDTDYSVGNLETVFAGKERVFSNYPAFNTPEQMGQSLAKVLGLDLLSLANNHIFDRGYAGLETTIDFLDSFGISHTGAYTSQEAYDTPFIAEIGGARVAFISATYGLNGAVPRDHPYAVRISSKESLSAASKAAVEAGADCVVALLHWGNEYENYASKQQRELAGWLFENTAISLIIGNHAHVVQPIEVFDVEYEGHAKQGVCLYALGNFTGEQLMQYRDGGILVRIGLDIRPGDPGAAQITQIEYTPTYIDSNPKPTGKRYRVISIYDAIAGYESGSDPLISLAEYRKMLHYRDYYAELLTGSGLVREYAIE